MHNLLTKEQAREFFNLKTIEATEKLLYRLGVPRVDFSIIGGKGIRFRKTDLEEALAKIEVLPGKSKNKPKRKKIRSDILDLPIKEQMAFFLTSDGPRQ